MDVDSPLTGWLLNTDPTLRWHVERDLVDAPPAVWQATKSRMATEGDGARLLALQEPDGQWAGGAFFPAGFDFEGPEAQPGAGQPWTATTWSLNSLRDWGMDADALLPGSAELIGANSTWEYNDGPFWEGEVDCCINAFTLASGAWLGADVSGLADWFLEHQLDDGGWNCEWENGSTRSSYHSTLNSLKGILFYETMTGGSSALTAARAAAEEYLLSRRLMVSLGTGELVAPWVTRFVYPFRSYYNVLNAAEYFRLARLADGAAPDRRMADAIDAIRAARQSDGSWIQEHRYPGRVWFELDVQVGERSPWITLFGTRVLDWWDRVG